jgi:hypothetical protein
VTAGTIALLVGIVWPALSVVVAVRIGRKLQSAGDRYPLVDEWGPTFVCPGCAECSP